MTHDNGQHGPRERLAMYGAPSLSDVELIAVLLGTGSRHQPVALVAAELLSCVGGLRALSKLGVDAIAAHPGIGPGKACRLQAALELGTRLAEEPLSRERSIRCSRDVDAALGPRLRGADREHFVAVALDAKHRPLRILDVAVGGLTACAVTPADAFRPLLREAAAGVIFAHNHPSGEPSPSDEDVAITRRLRRAGRLLGVPVLDHVIVARDGYFSFLDAGLLGMEPDPV
jgi:DNA repair protein RadC